MEALQFWVDLSKKYGIHPPGILEWGTTPSDFLEGRIAMIWTTTGNLSNIRKNAKFDFGVAPYPGKVAPASVLGGGNLYLFAKASAGREGRRLQVHQVPDLRRAPGGLVPSRPATSRPGTARGRPPALKAYVAEVPAADVARRQIASLRA